jgi:branched-chain amino acid transport system ATP-binding protein
MSHVAPEGAGIDSAGPLLAVQSLTVRYGLSTAVRNLDLSVLQGQALALLGVNGSGKSTVARALSGLVPVAAGQILFDGRDITGWPAHKIRRAGLIYLPEGRGIFPDLTVIENLRLSAGVIKNRSERSATVDRAMELFPSLKRREKNHAALLSGGEQQMLSLARALTTSPKLIVADELSLGLAPKMVDTVFESLELLKGTGATIILIEQFAARALKFAEYCAVLQRGSLSWHGESRTATSEVIAGYLGEAVATGV